MKDEVIEALRCCSCGDCSKCSYNEDANCTYDLPKDVMDILNKLQSDNEALKTQLQAAERVIHEMTVKLREKEGID